MIHMVNKSDSKLTFAFREFFPLYWASIRDYSENDYIIITKGKESVCYYIGDLKEIDKIRKQLLKKEFRLKLISNLEKTIKKVESYTPKTNVSKLSLKECQKELKTVFRLVLDWAEAYLFTEDEYWKGLENIISKKEQKQLSNLRFESKKVSTKFWKYIGRDIIPAIVKKGVVKSSNILLYSFDELMDLPKKPNDKIMDHRKKGWGIIKINKKRRLMSDKELKYYLDLIKQEQKLKNKELFGLAVHKGEVIGEVKVVKSKDMNKNKIFDLKNKILVTEMTKPEIVPFLKGCLGIITDEGGMLCHASIVAREFNLPCIVGTKNATKVLKDGQKVKLDANNGKIIIL